MLQQQEVIRAAGQCSWECARGLGRWQGEAKEGSCPAGPTGCPYPPTPAVLTVPQALGQPDLPAAPHLPQRVD